MKLYGQTLTARYKSLIVKVAVAAIKVNPSVNKVNIIIANKNKLSFLWRLFWDEKRGGMRESKNKVFLCLYL